jgi:S-layer protein transport system membrane fusion protein
MSVERVEKLPAPPVPLDWRGMVLFGWGIAGFIFLVLGSWAAIARIDSAVVASASIAVESSRKTVQHLEGGIVGELFVRDGDQVQEGDLLLRLDPTRNEATERTYRQQLAVVRALEARLLAQRDMREEIAFPSEVAEVSGEPLTAQAVADNQRQFETRRDGLRRATEVLDQQIAQARSEIEQAQVEERTARTQLASVNRELPVLQGLLQRGLVALPRVSAMEREQARLQGAVENARLNVSKGEEKIAELRARITQLQQDYRQEAANLLPDVRRQIGDVQQQIVIARDALRRVDIRAPVAGSVQQMRVFTIGGVIRPGDPIMDIVPEGDTLVVRARVAPYDRDRVRLNQAVEIRVPQFFRLLHAPIMGRLRSVSHDSLIDEVTRAPYFAAEITVERSSVPSDIAGQLTAGMTVDVIIPTEERTVLSYLVGPLMTRLVLGMRER